MSEMELDKQIDTVLERRREIAAPADFAGRVMRSLPPQRKRRRPVMPVRQTVAICTALILLLVMFVLAPQARVSVTNLVFDLELVMLVQVVGIGWLVFGREANSN